MVQNVALLIFITTVMCTLMVTFCEPSYNVTCECSNPDIVSLRIVNGSEAEEHEFPWLVAISDSSRDADSPLCGGTLITHQHVLTAGHCLEGFVNPKEARVYLGIKNIKIANNGIIPDKMIVHEEFIENTTGSFNDIGIIRLPKPVFFVKSIQPACLQFTEEDESQNENASVTIAGWGRTTEDGEKSDVLLKVKLSIVSRESCSSIFNISIPKNQFCAGEAKGMKDACQGDSGGPVHLQKDNGVNTVIGIVSYGNGCARPNSPGIYTRVVSYLEWIKSHIDSELLCSNP